MDSERIFISRRSAAAKKRRRIKLAIRIAGVLLACLTIAGIFFFIKSNSGIVKAYEAAAYGKTIYRSPLMADNLCVSNEEVEYEEFYRPDKFHGALFFDIKNNNVLYAEHIHERLYPASTTKLMTIYLALKYGKLDAKVEVSDNAVAVPQDSSKAGLKAGDKLSLEDLLYGLMLPSGNDSAIAIAEHISGSVEAFVELMNREANLLGATNTHFVNPHGYHDDEHYTTAYDLYLIFSACIKNDKFNEIISSSGREALITGKDGSRNVVTWKQSNKFLNGSRQVPRGIHFIGGKTGTTYEAGYCLVMYGKDAASTPYISIIMGATSSRNLYDNMTSLWSTVAG